MRPETAVYGRMAAATQIWKSIFMHYGSKSFFVQIDILRFKFCLAVVFLSSIEVHDGHDWARQITLSTQKVLLSKRCKHVHKSFASVTKAGPEYKEWIRRSRSLFWSYQRVITPWNFLLICFESFTKWGCQKVIQRTIKSWSLRWCWAPCSAGLVFSSQKLLFLTAAMWFLHLAVIQWPRGTNHYK